MNRDLSNLIAHPKGVIMANRPVFQAALSKLLFVLLGLTPASLLQAEVVTFLRPNDVIQITNLGEGADPRSINIHGQAVGQGGDGQARLWMNGSETILLGLGGPTSRANIITDDGGIAGRSDLANGLYKATEWSVGNPFAINLDPFTTLSSEVNDMNKFRNKVGYKTNGVVSRSALWGDGDIGGQLVFGGGDHRATGNNDKEETVGVDLQNNGGYYHDGVDDFNGFTSGLGSNYLPLAGINNNSLSAGQVGDSAQYSQVGQGGSVLQGALTFDSYSRGLNDNNLIFGEAMGTGYAFDLSTGETFHLNDFQRTGFAVDAIISVNDVNENNEFIGLARRGDSIFGFSGRAVAVPEPNIFALPFVAGKQVLVWMFHSDDQTE